MYLYICKIICVIWGGEVKYVFPFLLHDVGPFSTKNHKNSQIISSYENCSHFWDIFKNKNVQISLNMIIYTEKYTESDKRIQNNSL